MRVIAPNDGALIGSLNERLLLTFENATTDQYNVWIQRWIGLASGLVTSDDAGSAIVGLSSLAVLLSNHPPEPDFFGSVSRASQKVGQHDLDKADLGPHRK